MAATTPKDGANDASPGTDVTATFSEALDPASVVDETFKLVAEATGQVVTGKVSYDPATRKARLRPDQAAAAPGRLQGHDQAGAEDLVGNPMAKDHEWSFQTKADATTRPSRPPHPPGPGRPGTGPPPGPQPPRPALRRRVPVSAALVGDEHEAVHAGGSGCSAQRYV